MTIEELIERVDIVDYIGQFVELESRGREFWGCSPFSDDKTPSFSVNRDKGIFYDFSSQAGFGGNVFTFIQKYNKCTKKQAFEILAEYAGVSEEEIQRTEYDKFSAGSIGRSFHPKTKDKKVYTPANYQFDVMDRFDDSPQALEVWKREGISDGVLKKFQVKYDPFMNRLVYPIIDEKGKIVNIGGRSLYPDFKERHLHKYSYYHKWGTINVIYGLYQNYEYIIAEHEIILFEGCKSVLLAYTWGIKNTVALLTCHMNDNQFNILIALGVRVVLALDTDHNIFKDEKIKMLKEYSEVYYIDDFRHLLDYKDSPVDKGRETFELLYREKRRLGG